MKNYLQSIFKIKKKHDLLKLLCPNDLIFDIGAHLGHKTELFLSKGIRAILVEPLPFCFEELQKKFSKHQNITLINKGVGRTSDQMTLEINEKNPTTSTMSEHWKSGRFADEKWGRKIIVNMTTLDELIEDYGKPQYIKIDVEGFEFDVLSGLSQKAGIISFEFTSEFFNHSIDCLNLLEDLGYLQFNFSLGEDICFHNEWSNKNNIHKTLKSLIQNNTLLWGDLYCR